MSALNMLRYLANRVNDQQAAAILSSAGVRFRIGGTQWVSVDEDGKLVSDDGQPMSAGVGAFTGVEVGGERKTANGLIRGMEMQPTAGAPGSADYIPGDTVQQGRQLTNVGTGETVRKVAVPGQPGVYQTVAAAPSPQAALHANALQRPPVPGSEQETLSGPENQPHTGPANEQAGQTLPKGVGDSDTPDTGAPDASQA